MNNKYTCILEKIKRGESIDNLLSQPIVNGILTWYSNFCNECDINMAIELMYYFYVHENLDMYHVSEFQRECDYLERNFLLPRNKVLDAFQSFRALVNED